MQIEKGRVVTLNYTLSDEGGKLIDASKDGDFAYLHGAGNIIPGLENALAGKEAGETLTVSIAPEDAYGLRDDTKTQTVTRDMFPEDAEVKPGVQFHAQGSEGQPIVVTVTQVEGDAVTVDGNHPLAGVALHFEVEVMAIRDATAEELSHGHAHGPEGQHSH